MGCGGEAGFGGVPGEWCDDGEDGEVEGEGDDAWVWEPLGDEAADEGAAAEACGEGDGCLAGAVVWAELFKPCGACCHDESDGGAGDEASDGEPECAADHEGGGGGDAA